MRDNWRIVADPETSELVRTPERQVWDYNEEGIFSGDCDDAATLAASLLLAMGFQSTIIAIRMPYEMEFSHVFLRAYSGQDFIDIDPIVPSAELPIQNTAAQMVMYV